MKKVLLTGADGMLAKDFRPILEQNGYDVISKNKAEMDITDLNQVESIFSIINPNIVVHCAAYTKVDDAEENPELADKVNHVGTENIAKLCAKYNSLLIYISTDYVFDGKSKTPYLPDSTPNPINIYGKTKFLGEQAVIENCKDYIIARTSWLYGKHGKNFVETMIKLSEKPELKVVNDQIGCPTWTVDLSNALVKLLNDNKRGIYNICGAGSTSWYGFAQEIFKLMNLNVNLIPCQTSEFPQKAKRPKFSVMYNNDLCRNWKLALKEYLASRQS